MNKSELLNLDDWLEYINHQHEAVIDLTLDRMKPIAERLQVCHLNAPVVMVAGTNGKGSTVACLEAMYLTAHYRVGCY